VDYEWDEAKRRANLSKHGLDFPLIDDFEWETATIEPDDRHDYGEPRWIATGLLNARLCIVVFTYRVGRMRIISLRTAGNKEKARYAKMAPWA